MPDSLEYVVRPYGTPSTHGVIIIPATPKGTRQKAMITWGAKATMPDVETGVNFQVSCCKDNLTENDRKSDTIRIFQNGDESSENWVDLERAYQMALSKREHNSCGDADGNISGAAQEVDSALAEFDVLIHSGTAARPDKNCSATWNFPRA